MSSAVLRHEGPPRPVAGPPSSSRTALSAGALCALVALGVFFLRIGRPAYWLDETFTVDVATRSFSELLRLIAVRDAPNGPYYLLMSPWAAVSTSEAWVRAPSALAMAGVAGLLGWLVSRRAGTGAGLAAGLVLAVLPAVSRYAQEARPYALALFALAVASVAWAALEDRRGGPRDVLAGIVFAVAAAFAVVMNVMAAVVVVAQVIARVVDLRPGWRPRTLRTLSWAVLGGVLASPQVLLLLLNGAVGVANPAPAGWGSVWAAFTFTLQPWWVLVVAALAAVGLLPLADPARRPVVMLGLSWVVVVSGFLVVGALVQPSLAVGRYWLLTTPGWAVLAGLGCSVLAGAVTAGTSRPGLRTPAALLPVALVALLGAGTQASFRASTGHDQQDPRPALALLASAQYRDVPVIGVPDVVRSAVASYEPELLERMLLTTDPDPAGQLVLPNVDRATADARLADVDEVAVLGAADPDVTTALARQGSDLDPFTTVDRRSLSGWTVLLLRREP